MRRRGSSLQLSREDRGDDRGQSPPLDGTRPDLLVLDTVHEMLQESVLGTTS